MSKAVYFKLTNANEFVKDIRKKLAPEDLEVYAKITNTTSINVLTKTRERCPVVTGYLRRSYRIFFEKLLGAIKGIAGGVMTETEYAPGVEFGRTPHLFPSYHEEKDKFIQAIREAFGRQVKK